jgi:hypothetical protein
MDTAKETIQPLKEPNELCKLIVRQDRHFMINKARSLWTLPQQLSYLKSGRNYFDADYFDADTGDVTEAGDEKDAIKMNDMSVRSSECKEGKILFSLF